MSDRGGEAGPARGRRGLWIAAAIAIFLLLLWWAARAYRAREQLPDEPAGTSSGGTAAIASRLVAA